MIRYNRVMLSGSMASIPVLHSGRDGQPYCRMMVACFCGPYSIPVFVSGAQATEVVTRAVKGQRVFVDGRLSVSVRDGKEWWSVIARDVLYDIPRERGVSDDKAVDEIARM